MNRSTSKTLCKFRIFCLAVIVVVVPGCATPPPVDPLGYKNRTRSCINEDVTVTVAVPTITEAQAIYGVELAAKHIQPVWVEVKNDSANTYWFLPSGLDPDYFSPSEAAFAFHTDSDETNQQVDEKFQKLYFQNPVRPESTQAGFVLANLDEGFKAVDIDLISREAVKNFSFIIADPEFRADYKLVDFETLYTAEEIIDIEDEQGLRRVLEELPCCTTNANGDEYGDPLNLVYRWRNRRYYRPSFAATGTPRRFMSSRAILRTIKSFLQGYATVTRP